ncbi:MAG TPA: universal stress protein [Candidatus Didemnitutus sp.]|nr:universal stress protein [Candidatus Didemnitutus sp.]
MKTILAAVDLSNSTGRVVHAGVRLARASGARLDIIHVIPPPAIVMNDVYAVDATLAARIVDAANRYATRRLQALARRCRARGVDVRIVQLDGDPLSRILKEAADRKPECVVIGSHGHTAAYDLLVGSVAHGLLRKAGCPVLVVPSGRRRRR